MPSLAERRDDVELLANSIVAARARSLGKALEGLSPPSEEMLADYSWPGNLGELQSVVERAVVLATGTSVDIPTDLLREGRRVGGYTLERQLGSGAMGEVWLARHALLARPSAVKLIRQEAMQADSSAREMLEQRFQREAQVTSQLRSPHTVELYDFGVTEDGDFYYVMGYLNGVDLESLVTKYGPVEPARAVFLLCQACMSLGEAHSAGLVHRTPAPVPALRSNEKKSASPAAPAEVTMSAGRLPSSELAMATSLLSSVSLSNVCAVTLKSELIVPAGAFPNG